MFYIIVSYLKKSLICNPVIGFSTNNPDNLFLRFVDLFGELFTSSSAIVPFIVSEMCKMEQQDLILRYACLESHQLIFD
jgi:hypothetical protein